MAPAAVLLPVFTTATSNIHGYKQALNTAALTLDYQKSHHLVEAIARDEEARRLKCQLLLLQDDNDNLNNCLVGEELLVQQLDAAQKHADQMELAVCQMEDDMRIRDREHRNAEVELATMSARSSDSAQLLAEKLALIRKLDLVEPELQALHQQVKSHRLLLSEKLALDHQVATLQAELENSQEAAQRAQAKAGNQGNQSAQLNLQIDDLQKKLHLESAARREAEAEVGRLLPLVEAAKGSSGDADAIAHLRGQVKQLQQDLLAAKQGKHSAERALQQDQSAWEAKKSLQDDKLDQFRQKLRSTKDKLTKAEAQIEQLLCTQLASSATVAASKPAKAPKAAANRKRKAAHTAAIHVDSADSAMATPGDHHPTTKRGKRDQSSAPGEKSNFSITPFLNRTTLGIAPETPVAVAGANLIDIEQVTDADEAAPTAAVRFTADQSPMQQDMESPTQTVAKRKKAPKKPLGPASSSKQNAKALGRKMPNLLPSLPEVAEDLSVELVKPLTVAASESTSSSKSAVIANAPRLKPRKSLMTFTSYTTEPVVEKKKRKLGVAKTLFDEEDEGNAVAAKPIPGRGIFAARALNKGRKLAPLGSKVLDQSGFQFSPLKRDRRARGNSGLE